MMQRKRTRQPTPAASSPVAGPLSPSVHLWSLVWGMVVVLRPAEAWMAPRTEPFSSSPRQQAPAAARPSTELHQTSSGSPPMMSLPTVKATSSLPSSRPDTRRNFRNSDVDDMQQVRYSPRRPTSSSTSVAKQRQHRFRVYCDLDGVLVDFCTGVKQLYKDEELEEYGFRSRSTLNVDELHRGSMWQRVAHADSFFEHLPWTEAGQSLWEVVRQLRPTILTGVPVNPPSSRQQKVDWCRRNLGIPVIQHTDKAGNEFQHVSSSSSSLALSLEEDEVMSLPPIQIGHSFGITEQQQHQQRMEEICHVITCWSNNKHYESGPGAVLIDDRIELKEAWESKGGIFIHHNGNAEETIAQLYKHGIVQEFLQS